MRDTIFAPATASGRAAVAIVRISGPSTAVVMGALCGRLPPARKVAVRKLRAGDDLLDEAVVIWSPGPKSFTGEDAGEFQTHGGPAVVEAVCKALAAQGARLAEPGEFARRAFEAGRLDLTQAEAIADLVDAETDAQRRQATAQLSGVLSDRYRAWRERLLDALAMVEAGIDFPEDDVPDGLVSRAQRLVAALVAELDTELGDSRGERTRGGLRIALIGPPNVGKSSLLNALTGRDAAIVTAVAGTTRDVVEAHVVWNGHAVMLLDTAGLRETSDVIEAEGIARARRSADEADLRLAVGDASQPETVEAAAKLRLPGDILVVNKIDLQPHGALLDWPDATPTVATSGGVTGLKGVITERMEALTTGADFPAITRQRHRAILTECHRHLTRLVERAGLGAELAGEDIRLAIRALESLAGRSDPEAVLDRVFSTFCIGK